MNASHAAMESAPSSRLLEEISEVIQRLVPGEWRIVDQVVSGSRSNFVIELGEGSSAERLWCRASEQSIDEALGSERTLRQELSLLESLTRLGVRIPKVLASSPSGRVIVQQYVEQQTSPASSRASVIELYMTALDQIHALDAALLLKAPLGELDAPSAAASEHHRWLTLADHAKLPSVSTAQAELEHLPERLDAMVRALGARTAPIWEEPLSLVHGDAGRANFLYDVAGDVWLIDWELAHLGSRFEDYAWCELRGLEKDSQVWQRSVVSRVARFGIDGPTVYTYFRMLIYLRSAIAIAARIGADPENQMVPYLSRRFCESERLGWLSLDEYDRVTDRPVGQALPAHLPAVYGLESGRNERLREWHRWTDDLRALGKHSPLTLQGTEESDE